MNNEEETLIVAYVTDTQINAAFVNGSRIYFDSFALVGNDTPYDVYKTLIDKIGENLVSEIILVDYVENFQFYTKQQLTGIGKMQMIVELACTNLQIPFQAISFESAMKYASNTIQTTKEDFASEQDYVLVGVAEYRKKLNEINKHKSVALYKLANIDMLKTIDLLTQDTYMGVVYILEYGDMVKIGSSKHPYKRFTELKRQAEKYGNIKVGDMAISGLHTNFRNNEKVTHYHFQKFRREGTELFNIDFVIAKDYLNTLNLLDETEKIDKDAETFKDRMANFIFGDGLSHLNNQNK